MVIPHASLLMILHDTLIENEVNEKVKSVRIVIKVLIQAFPNGSLSKEEINDLLLKLFLSDSQPDMTSADRVAVCDIINSRAFEIFTVAKDNSRFPFRMRNHYYLSIQGENNLEFYRQI
jgi:hypothetical protein